MLASAKSNINEARAMEFGLNDSRANGEHEFFLWNDTMWRRLMSCSSCQAWPNFAACDWPICSHTDGNKQWAEVADPLRGRGLRSRLCRRWLEECATRCHCPVWPGEWPSGGFLCTSGCRCIGSLVQLHHLSAVHGADSAVAQHKYRILHHSVTATIFMIPEHLIFFLCPLQPQTPYKAHNIP